jgi:mono/diheme cytochrome c family protein
MYKGDRKKFNEQALTAMHNRKSTAQNIRTPDSVKDNLSVRVMGQGAVLYGKYCANCHQANGMGDGTRNPPLAGSEWVTGDRHRLMQVVIHGLSGPITVKGVGYNEAMPSHAYLKDPELAAILSYVRQSWGNQAGFITTHEIPRNRRKKDKLPTP